MYVMFVQIQLCLNMFFGHKSELFLELYLRLGTDDTCILKMTASISFSLPSVPIFVGTSLKFRMVDGIKLWLIRTWKIFACFYYISIIRLTNNIDLLKLNA